MKKKLFLFVCIAFLPLGWSDAEESNLPVTAEQQKALTPEKVLTDLLEGNHSPALQCLMGRVNRTLDWLPAITSGGGR
jgi:hypothetical protein